MAHQRENVSVFKAFCQVLEPVIPAGKLGCILAQFPYGFQLNRSNWDYLKLLRERLGELPVIVEFRNAQWLRSEVFDWLRHLDLGFCCVDEPQLPNLLPPLAEATSEIGYIRFHGRNSAKWWQHEQAYERYDYSYTPKNSASGYPRFKNWMV